MKIHYLKLRDGHPRDVIGVHVKDEVYSHLLFLYVHGEQIAFRPFIEFAKDVDQEVNLAGDILVACEASPELVAIVESYHAQAAGIITPPSKKLIT
jgi:hypothetical protein